MREGCVEPRRWAARNARLERHLVAAPWPFAVAVTGEDRIVAGEVGVDAAEDFLQQGGEERVHLVRRPDEQLPVRPENVKRLLDHVDLQLALAGASRQVDQRLEVGRQVPQVSGRDDTDCLA